MARNTRIAIVAAVALVLTLALSLRAVQLGVLRADDLKGRAAAQQQTVQPDPARRGEIRDRTGQPLASDRPAADVIATPYLIDDPAATARALAGPLHLAPATIEAALRATGGYVRVARGIAPDQGDAIRALRINGITIEPTLLREQPGGAATAQVVGLVDEKRRGAVGLERIADATLRGTDGTVRIVRDGRGEVVHRDPMRRARGGTSIATTIDAPLQQWTARTVEATRERTDADAVSALVMDPATGAILAVASSPGFDPNRREEIDPASMRLRAFTDQYEPGSTFKLLTIAQAIEKRAVTPDTMFGLPATLARYDRTLRDAEERGAISASVRDILTHSSNIGTVLVGDRIGHRNVQSIIERFGFGRPTGVEFPGEATGFVLPLEQWSGSSSLNIPIGQGVSVTLIQMARAFATIANGGRLVSPHILAANADRPTSQVLSARTTRQMRAMLEGVIEDGTGTKAQLPGYSVAGKTGTANKVVNGRYVEAYDASFIGFAPARKPRFVIAVLVDNPQGAFYGGDVAAPAFADIARFALSRAGIAQDRPSP